MINELIKRGKDVVDRINAPTPTHFKRITAFGLGLIILGLIILLIAAIWPTPTLISIEGKLVDKLIYIGLTMAGISVTAKQDPKCP